MDLSNKRQVRISRYQAKDFFKKLLDRMNKTRELKEPIYKGCLNIQCFCTGACREIIGYKDK